MVYGIEKFKQYFGDYTGQYVFIGGTACFILLNDSYYDLLVQGKTIVDGYSVLSIEYILLFKIKAWLDLLERKENWEHIDSRDINKHKNDIFRLVINISPSSKVSVSDEIQNDITTFLKRIIEERIDLKNLGIRAVSLEDILNRIKKIYGNIT